jgi:hypothetical protein
VPTGLTALAWLAGLGVVVLVGRWATHRVDALGRRRQFPVVSTSLLAVVALGCIVLVVQTERLQDRLSEVATELVGAPVTVDCQSRGQEMLDVGNELGQVRFDASGRPEPRTLIKRRPCADLERYLEGEQGAPTRGEVVAVHVLSHEARHLAGQKVEAETECAAMQRDARTARLLGASPEEALALARTYWNEVYPEMPADYRSAACAPGGALDERLPDPPWAP